MATTTGDPKALVTEYAEIWNDQEFERFSDTVADSFTFTSPTSGTIRGRENVEAYARDVAAAFPDFEITVHEMLAGENLVMTESTISGTHEGAFDGIPATNETVEIRDMAKFVVEDGKLQDEHTFFDRHEFLGQLGLLEE
ncbi:ester cyclase [Natrinema salsiterrestre]|uniref:Ester cyclase n=1 Tax=Natrinema salsiterrestre TaxID=2950540 RepID=A0A9Q4KXB2_9EURY|nr:ester cyclase [Natrinema salsiterrestre]MDF9744968.1 ester cyclase [Natrinema salsiterrestre]